MDMDCTQTRNYMHAHLDRELDPVTAAGIETHMRNCAACAQAYATQTALRNAVKKQAAYFTAPAALAARVLATAGAAGNYPGARTARRWSWLPLAAAVAATVVIMWTASVAQSPFASLDAQTMLRATYRFDAAAKPRVY